VSIVVPVYREEAGLAHFAHAVVAALDRLGLPAEVIFVEDDSPDGSWAQIQQLHCLRPNVFRGLSLSRRFGHQASLAAGLEAARGDVVICMDCDMQHPPALLPLLLWKWSQGYQLVYTRRRRQRGRSRTKELASRLFYRALNWVIGIRLEEGSADFRLMDRVVVDALRRFCERELFYRGLVQWAGFRRSVVEYEAPPRYAGSSSYTWARLLHLGVDALFAFSLVPLRLSFVGGALALLLTVGYALWAVVCWLRGGVDAAGYTSLVVLVSMLGSLHLLCLGVIGEYVGRVHEQVKRRPLYLVKESLGVAIALEDAAESSRARV
jgi:dolichol-phosphate mannosyltransferase